MNFKFKIGKTHMSFTTTYCVIKPIQSRFFKLNSIDSIDSRELVEFIFLHYLICYLVLTHQYPWF